MRKGWILFLIGALSFLFFYSIRFKYGLAGDNWLHVGQIERGEFFAAKNGIGSLTTMCLFYKLVHLFGANGFQSIQLFSALLGVGYATYSYLISRELGKDRFEKWSLFTLLMILPISFHFHGLIEIHALPILGLVAFYYYALLAVRGKMSKWIPCVVWAISLSFHLVAVTALPAFGFIFFNGKYRRAWFAASLLILAVAMGMSPNNFHPIGPWPGRFELFSDLNVIEFLNGQLMGVWPLIVGAPFLFRKMNMEIKMIGAIAAYQLIFFFCFDSLLGAANWELDVVPSYAVAIVVLWAVFQSKAKRRATKIIAGLMLAHSGTAMALGMSDISIKKFTNDLKNDEAWYYKTHSKNVVWYLTMRSNGLTK